MKSTESRSLCPTDLIWDLEADLRPESVRGRIALTAKALNELDPLQDLIYYPLSGGSSRGKIKISSICNDIHEIRLLEDKTQHMTQSQRNPLVTGIPFNKRASNVAQNIASFLNSVLQDQNARTYRDSVILRPGGMTLVLSVYEQVLITLGEVPRDGQMGEFATALILALEDIVGGRAAAETFVKNRLTSYAQRREVIAQVVNKMRGILEDQEFGRQGIQSETPLQKRVATVERKLAEQLAVTLGIETISDLRQKAPEAIWKRVQERSTGQGEVPYHEFLTLGEIKVVMEQKNNRPLAVPMLMERAFSSEDEVFVALNGLNNLRAPLQHGRTHLDQKLGEAYLSAFERALDL